MAHAKATAEVQELALNKITSPFVKSVGTQQFLTLTLRDTYDRVSPHMLWLKIMPKLIKNMRRVSPLCWKIFPELTEKGRIHFHIMCDHNNYMKMKAFRGWWSRVFGYSDLRNITPGHWLAVFIYCRKENNFMQHEVLRLPLYKSRRVMMAIPNESSYYTLIDGIQEYYSRLRKRTRERTCDQIMLSKFHHMLVQRVPEGFPHAPQERSAAGSDRAQSTQ